MFISDIIEAIAALGLLGVLAAILMVAAERRCDRTALLRLQRSLAYRCLLRAHGQWQGHGGTIAFERGLDARQDVSVSSQLGV